MNEIIKGARFHHVALRSNCFDKSYAFYTSLGFKNVLEWGEAGSRAVMLDIGDGGCFEMFEGELKGEQSDPRYFHLAVFAEDVDAAYELALRSGGTTKFAPYCTTIRAKNPVDIRIAFVYGPSGEEVEFFKTV